MLYLNTKLRGLLLGVIMKIWPQGGDDFSQEGGPLSTCEDDRSFFPNLGLPGSMQSFILSKTQDMVEELICEHTLL